MKKLFILFAVALLPLMCWASQTADTEYLPMLQEGKCWKYTKVIRDYFYYPTFAQGRKGEYYVTHYLKGKTTIDDKEFYNVYKHISFDTPTDIDESDSIVAYLYEDITEGKVYVTVDFESFWENAGLTDTYFCLWEEGKRDNTLLLYDFNNPDDCAVTNNCEYTGEVAFENQGIPYDGRTYSHFVTNFMIVPGLGVVCPDQDLTTGTANIFGVDYCNMPHMPCSHGLCHLYEVVDGDGKVIYYDERVAPGWTDKYIYKPMLEEGKCWKYTEVCPGLFYYPIPNSTKEREVSYELKGKTVIDDIEYFNLYINYDHDFNNGYQPYFDCTEPFAYLYEDIDNGKVWVKLLPYISGHTLPYFFYDALSENNPALLYDFYDPDNGTVTTYSEKIGEVQFENSGYSYNGISYIFNGLMDYLVVPGLGIICMNQSLENGAASIFGVDLTDMPSMPNYESYLHLYEVTDGEGNVIYYDERVAPGWTSGLDSLKSLTQESEMHYDGKTVKLAGSTASVYNAQGKLVNRYESQRGNVTFSTDGYAKGVYIVNFNGKCRKIIVK